MGRNGTPAEASRPPERAGGRPARAGTLDHEPGISMLGLREAGDVVAGADVALHVVESSSDPNVADEVRRLRELADVPLILAAYGVPNGIVETGLAVGAADVLVLPQPTETLLFALRKAARAAGGNRDRQGRHRLLAEGRKRQDRARHEPRCRDRALRPEDAPRRPRPAVRRLGTDAGSDARGRRSPTSPLRRRHRRARSCSRSSRTDAAHRSSPCCPRRCVRRRPRCGRPGRPRGRSRRGTQRIRGDRHRHRAAVRRGDARGARPHRQLAARLQPRGHVAEERPHRSGDDRPARLRRASVSRSSPTASARRALVGAATSSTRSTRRSRSSCPTIPPSRPQSTARCPSSLPTRRASSHARLRELLPSVFPASAPASRPT